MESILKIKDLHVHFKTLDGRLIHALNGVNLDVNSKETIAIVGESGSGKTQLSLSIMNLLASNSITKGEIIFEDKNLLSLSLNDINKIRGTKISMIFQDPMTSLNPYLTVADQMTEVLIKNGLSHKEAMEKSIEMLNMVSITDPHKRIGQYPHQFSGGMRQRIMIAMALLSKPAILIADEPTTALDVTIQAQILDIFAKLKEELNLSIIIVTHDLGVVSNIADKIAVFYGGNIVEYGSRDDVFNNPKHPYTQALIKSIPKLDQNKEEPLFLIKGMPQVILQEPNSCSFKDRCPHAFDKCFNELPKAVNIKNNHIASCFLLKEEI